MDFVFLFLLLLYITEWIFLYLFDCFAGIVKRIVKASIVNQNRNETSSCKFISGE